MTEPVFVVVLRKHVDSDSRAFRCRDDTPFIEATTLLPALQILMLAPNDTTLSDPYSSDLAAYPHGFPTADVGDTEPIIGPFSAEDFNCVIMAVRRALGRRSGNIIGDRQPRG